MKGNPTLNQALNKVLRSQLTAINQYFLHARLCKHWGLAKLNHLEYHYSIDAMKQADALIERILFLEGLPNLQDLGKLYIAEDVAELLTNDQRLVMAVITELRDVIALCEQQQDYISRQLLQDLLEEEEEHLDWLESQQWAIQNVGMANYLQTFIETGAHS